MVCDFDRRWHGPTVRAKKQDIEIADQHSMLQTGVMSGIKPGQKIGATLTDYYLSDIRKGVKPLTETAKTYQMALFILKACLTYERS